MKEDQRGAMKLKTLLILSGVIYLLVAIFGNWGPLVVTPILNCLAIFYALVPGHSLGIALICLTLFIRLLMFPLTKRNAQQTRTMRRLQPEIAKIKKRAGDNRQRVALETMALYRKHSFNPLSTFGYILVQIPIFIGVYQVIRKIADDTQALVGESYSFVADLGWMQKLANGEVDFNPNFLGIDLTKEALGDSILWGAVFIALAAVIVQYLASRQSLAMQQPTGPKKRVRELLKKAKEGHQVDQSEMNAAMNAAIGKNLVYVLPVILFAVSLWWPAAIAFYWFWSSGFTYIQQHYLYRLPDPIDVQSPTKSSQPNAKAKRTSSTGRKRVKANVKSSKIKKED